MDHKLKESLQKNIITFFKEKLIKVFTPNIALDLLIYCIKNNDLFAVHYDTK